MAAPNTRQEKHLLSLMTNWKLPLWKKFNSPFEIYSNSTYTGIHLLDTVRKRGKDSLYQDSAELEWERTNSGRRKLPIKSIVKRTHPNWCALNAWHYVSGSCEIPIRVTEPSKRYLLLRLIRTNFSITHSHLKLNHKPDTKLDISGFSCHGQESVPKWPTLDMTKREARRGETKAPHLVRGEISCGIKTRTKKID